MQVNLVRSTVHALGNWSQQGSGVLRLGLGKYGLRLVRQAVGEDRGQQGFSSHEGEAATMTMRSPIWWFGGKGRMVKKLLPLFPPHHTYVEAFGGGASLLFAKRPSPVEVYNDLDGGLVNFFRVLRDPRRFKQLYRLVQSTPYAREEYDFCRETWQDCADDVERAWRWFVVARMSFSGRFGSGYGSVVTTSDRGMAGTCSNWLSIIDQLPQIHARLMRVQIENSDWRVILDRYDTLDTLFYLDPPYLPDTRSSGKYKHELTLEDHADLVGVLLDIKGKAILSGYDHEVYTPLADAGWQKHTWATACYAAGRTRNSSLQGAGAALDKQARVECAWVSPGDSRQLGLFP